MLCNMAKWWKDTCIVKINSCELKIIRLLLKDSLIYLVLHLTSHHLPYLHLTKEGKWGGSPSGILKVILFSRVCTTSQQTSSPESPDSKHDYVDSFKNLYCKSYLKHTMYLALTWKHVISLPAFLTSLVLLLPYWPLFLTLVRWLLLNFPTFKCWHLLYLVLRPHLCFVYTHFLNDLIPAKSTFISSA